MLKLRLLTAAVLVPLLLAAMFLLPSLWWKLVLLIPLVLAAREWSALSGFGRGGETIFLLGLAAGVGVLWMMNKDATRVVLALSVGFWAVVAPVWLWLKMRVRNHLALGLAGVATLLPMWLAFVELQRTPLVLLLLLAVVWIADTAAYFFGHKFGRRKLAPAISPGKTWEGVAGALGTVTVYALLLQYFHVARHDFSLVPIFLGMTVFSIVGDLFESWLKRGAGVKDSGSILPGHGGVLDRVDALTAALPLAALVFAA